VDVLYVSQEMKLIALTILISAFCGSCATEDSIRRARFYSDPLNLKHEIEYYGAHADGGAYFIATLSNPTDQNVRVMVSKKMFCSKIMVKSSANQEYEVYEIEYLDLLRTSSFWNPVVDLNAGDVIRWNVPLGSLVTSQGQPVTEKSLRGSVVTSELRVSASDLKSKPIRIQ
jgi:hypothetical protein